MKQLFSFLSHSSTFSTGWTDITVNLLVMDAGLDFHESEDQSGMRNPAIAIPTWHLRTTTWRTTRRDEYCLHRLPTCCTISGPDGDESKCCACLDSRPHNLLYDQGPNGVVVEDGSFSRQDYYCEYCRSKCQYFHICSM